MMTRETALSAHVTIEPRQTGRLDALADSHEHCDAALIQLPMIPGCLRPRPPHPNNRSA